MSVRFPNLGLEFEYVPVSVRVFGFEITFFGILLAVGMLLGIAFVVLEAKRKKQDANLYLGMMISGLAGGFIGARFFYVLLSWSVYKTDIMKVFDTRNGGMVFYGGLLGGVLAAAVFCRVKKAVFMEMADVAVKGLLIGQIIGRWGNFFNRESSGNDDFRACRRIYRSKIFLCASFLERIQNGYYEGIRYKKRRNGLLRRSSGRRSGSCCFLPG